MYTDSYIQKRKSILKRRAYAAWKNKDAQNFLASFFPIETKKKLMNPLYDDTKVNDFIITKTKNKDRGDYFYEVFSDGRLKEKKKNRDKTTPKMNYLPSTGGMQKYKTVPRKI